MTRLVGIPGYQAVLRPAALLVARAIEGLAGLMAHASGALFLLTAFYIAADVVARRFLGISSGVADELGGYVLAFGGMSTLAYTLRRGGHVRVDMLLPYLPSRVRALLDRVALLGMAAFASMVSVYAWRMVMDSWSVGARAVSILGTPLALPQALLAFGFTALAAQAIVLMLGGSVAPPRDDAVPGDASPEGERG